MLEYNNAASYNSNLKTDFKTNPVGQKKNQRDFSRKKNQHKF